MQKPTRRERERNRRVELILDSAEELFLENGFAATTMNDIGEAAEFGRATLYHYFPSKEAIYVSIVERGMGSVIARIRESVAKGRSSEEKLQNIKRVIFSFLRQKRNFFRLYFITYFEVLPYLDKKLASRLRLKIDEMDGVFHGIYCQGVKDGEFKPDNDPLVVADIFFGQIVGLMLLNSTVPLEPSLTANVNKATSFLLDNIRATREETTGENR